MRDGLPVTIWVRHEATEVWPLSAARSRLPPQLGGPSGPVAAAPLLAAEGGNKRREIRFRHRNEISRASPDEPLVPRVKKERKKRGLVDAWPLDETIPSFEKCFPKLGKTTYEVRERGILPSAVDPLSAGSRLGNEQVPLLFADGISEEALANRGRVDVYGCSPVESLLRARGRHFSIRRDAQ
ncbi:hypothetical protein MRX96_019190 [Rhipicephalus microplus]